MQGPCNMSSQPDAVPVEDVTTSEVGQASEGEQAKPEKSAEPHIKPPDGVGDGRTSSDMNDATESKPFIASFELSSSLSEQSSDATVVLETSSGLRIGANAGTITAPFKLPASPPDETLDVMGTDSGRSDDKNGDREEGPTVVPFRLPILPFRKSKKDLQTVTPGTEPEPSNLSGSSSEKEGSKAENTRGTGVELQTSSGKREEDANNDSSRSKRRKAVPSPAEKLKIAPLPYKEPSWGGRCTSSRKYTLEILKGGKILDTLTLNEKSFYVFGRLEGCDVVLEHPSISRYHLVLQYRMVGDSERDPGFYLYDLGSTHGSQFNKTAMKARVYHRIKVGHQFKLGGSTRIFILQGPPEDEEVVSELSVTQLKELKRRAMQEQEELKKKNTEAEAVTGDKDEGVSWGMGDDAEEEIDMDNNPYNVMSQAEKEASYVKDPKKTLRGYFEREGLELEYQVEEKGSGFNQQYLCKVELPVDDADGEPITAEAAVSGKKKESVIACAMEACRILDAHGVLRQAVHESKSKKKKNWADDDFYDSDDDSYLDRTGMIERKREKRMMKAGVIKQEVDTYETLTEKLKKLNEELDQSQKELEVLKQEQSSGTEEDTLDAFISQLKSGKTMDKTKRAKMKLHIIELKKEQSRLQRLIRLVQPATLDSQSSKSESKFAALSQRLPMKGLMKGRKIPSTKPKTAVLDSSAPVKSIPPVRSIPSEEEEMTVEEEEEEEEEEDEEVLHETGRVTDDPSTGSDVQHSEEIRQKAAESRVSSVDIVIEKQPEPPKPSPSQKRPKRVQGPQMGPLINFKQFMNRDETDEEGPEVKRKKEKDFADWIPPDDQKGDGRTFLNDKYGY